MKIKLLFSVFLCSLSAVSFAQTKRTECEAKGELALKQVVFHATHYTPAKGPTKQFLVYQVDCVYEDDSTTSIKYDEQFPNSPYSLMEFDISPNLLPFGGDNITVTCTPDPSNSQCSWKMPLPLTKK